MERKDLLKANVAIFKSQGSALEKFSKKTVKVLRSGFYNTIHLLGHYKSVKIQVSEVPVKSQGCVSANFVCF